MAWPQSDRRRQPASPNICTDGCAAAPQQLGQLADREQLKILVLHFETSQKKSRPGRTMNGLGMETIKAGHLAMNRPLKRQTPPEAGSLECGRSGPARYRAQMSFGVKYRSPIGHPLAENQDAFYFFPYVLS
jgi:hypothetical protein